MRRLIARELHLALLTVILLVAIALLIAFRDDPTQTALVTVLTILIGGAGTTLLQAISQTRERIFRRDEARDAALRELRLERRRAVVRVLESLTHSVIQNRLSMRNTVRAMSQSQSANAARAQLNTTELLMRELQDAFTSPEYTSGLMALASFDEMQLLTNISAEVQAYLDYSSRVIEKFNDSGQVTSLDEFNEVTDSYIVNMLRASGRALSTLDTFVVTFPQ